MLWVDLNEGYHSNLPIELKYVSYLYGYSINYCLVRETDTMAQQERINTQVLEKLKGHKGDQEAIQDSPVVGSTATLSWYRLNNVRRWLGSQRCPLGSWTSVEVAWDQRGDVATPRHKKETIRSSLDSPSLLPSVSTSASHSLRLVRSL